MPIIVYSPSAERDLEEIGYYIGRHNRLAAREFLARIHKTCQSLAAHSQMGELRPELAGGNYRSFSVGNYVLFFKPIDNGVWIARVLHGARDHGPLLGDV